MKGENFKSNNLAENINNKKKQDKSIVKAFGFGVVAIIITAVGTAVGQLETFRAMFIYMLVCCLLPILLGIVSFIFALRVSDANINSGKLLFCRICAVTAVVFPLARLVSVVAAMFFAFH